MGTAITNFQSIVGTQTLGTADVDKMTAAFLGLEGAIDRASKKGDHLNEHKGWGEFAEKVKQGIEDPLHAIGGAAEEALKSLGPLGVGVTATFGVMATASYVAFEAAKALGEYGTQVQNAALRTGLTTKEVGQFSFAARAAGGDVSMFERAMRKLSEGLQDGTEDGKKARQALADLGVESRERTTGAMRPMSDLFVQISEGLRGIEEPAKRDAEAVRLFGRAGIELLPTMINLGENFARAKELGLGASDADVRRWEEYHHRVLELEVTWERLVRKIKEPLAAVIMIALRDTKGHEYTLEELEERGVNVGRFRRRTEFGNMVAGEAAGVPNDERRGWMNRGILGAVESRTDRFEQRRAADAAVEAFEARRSRGLDQQLQEAEAALKEMKLPTAGVSSIDDVKAYEAAERKVAGLKAQTQAAKELESALKALHAWEATVGEKAMTPVEKIFAERDRHASATQQYGEATDAALPAALDALQKMREDRGVVTARINATWDKHLNDELHDMQENTTRFVRGWLQNVHELQATARAIDDIDLRSQREEITARAGRADRMQQLSLGPGHEAEAVAAGYQIRLALAQRLYDLDVQVAEKEIDTQQQRKDFAKAEADLHRQTYEADIEREMRVAQLQRERIDRWRSTVVGGLHAVESGDPGGFLKSQGQGLLDRMVGNGAEMVWKDVSKIIPHAAGGSFLGKLLAGSEFGPDPVKVATDANTMATIENTFALRQMALSRSGGGGGLVRSLAGVGAWTGSFTGAASGEPTIEDLWNLPLNHPEAAANPRLTPGISFERQPSRLGRWAGIGGAAITSGLSIYSGIEHGGAQGISSAVGGLLSGAGAIMSLASKALAWAGPVGMIAGLGLDFLPGLLGGDPKRRRGEEEDQTIAAARYIGPTSTRYTMDRYGRSYDSDMAGNARPIIVVNLPVSAIDGRDVIDRGPQLAESLALVLEARVAPRLANAVRNTAFPNRS